MAKRKLTDEQVQQIRCLEEARVRALAESKMYSRENIGKRYGVSYSVVTSIIDGTAYANVPDVACKEET
jgi:ParB-like chromosome segregation protein Spo0J